MTSQDLNEVGETLMQIRETMRHAMKQKPNVDMPETRKMLRALTVGMTAVACLQTATDDQILMGELLAMENL